MSSQIINDSLPLDALERIDNVCSEFEESLKAEKPFRIETLLTDFVGRERDLLLLELLLLDFAYRRAAGDSISSEDYLSRFPDDQQTVREAIDHPTHAFDATIADLQPAQASVTYPERLQYLGDYEILEEIARGGMGIVFKARQSTLGRIVAVKMMLNGQFSSHDQIARFKREAKLAARLQHPNIVAVHEVGEYEGMPYFSMDYVDGQSLAEIVRDKPLPPRIAADYVHVVAMTVHRTHEEGILHRDLKPSNILIDRDDRVRITDFGLAKAMEPGGTLTASESTIGSPSYMPPEQAEGNQSLVSVKSDVYSLGAVLYELLTGRPPFAAATVLETIRLMKTLEPVPPRVFNPGIPKDLETICLKCLEKEPHKRYGTAEELAGDLQRFMDGEPISARPISRIERTWRLCRKNPLQSLIIGIVVVFFVDLFAVNVLAPYILGDSVRLSQSGIIGTRVWARQCVTLIQLGMLIGLLAGAITSQMIYRKLRPALLVAGGFLVMVALTIHLCGDVRPLRENEDNAINSPVRPVILTGLIFGDSLSDSGNISVNDRELAKLFEGQLQSTSVPLMAPRGPERPPLIIPLRAPREELQPEEPQPPAPPRNGPPPPPTDPNPE